MSADFMLSMPWFKTFVTGSGFFADSYDLFVTDGVTNILKALGPFNVVTQNTTDGTLLRSYSTFMCPAEDASCGVFLQSTGSPLWDVSNPAYNSQNLPLYQAQTGDLKNGVNNAALIGSILGQLLFGLSADLFGRKWCFVITSTLIIMGCLGSASSAAGHSVLGVLAGNGLWANTLAQPTSIVNDVYTQLIIWRAILGFGGACQ